MIVDALIPPLITPLLPDEQIDRKSLATHTERVLENGSTGVFVLGSSGEGPLLTLEQRQAVVRTTGDALRGRGPLYVGVADTSAKRVRELMDALNTPEVTAFVVTVPFYGTFPDADVQVDFFASLADAAPKPLVLYNIPPAVHTTVGPQAVARLVAHPNIIGIKDSQGDLSQFQEFLALRAEQDFAVFQGAEKVSGLSMLAGANGLVVGMGNLVPAWFAELLAAARAQDVVKTQQIQARINAVWPVHTYGHWLSCLKMTASLLGFCGPTVSAPVPPLSTAAIASIRLRLEENGLL